MTIDAIAAAIITLALSTLVGLITWLVKGRLDRSDYNLDRLKEHVVYEDTCLAHREAIVAGNKMVAASLQTMQGQLTDQGKVLGGLAIDVTVIKSSLPPRQAVAMAKTKEVVSDD